MRTISLFVYNDIIDMDKKIMLEQLIDYFNNGNKSQFAKRLGITPQGLSTWMTRSTFDNELVFSKCEGVSAEWLLTGKGPMINNQDLVNSSTENQFMIKDQDDLSDSDKYEKDIKLSNKTLEKMIERLLKLLDESENEINNLKEQLANYTKTNEDTGHKNNNSCDNSYNIHNIA